MWGFGSRDALSSAKKLSHSRAADADAPREFGAARDLARLGGDAVKKLEAALSDPSKFGMAKSLFMGGREAGFDVDSKEGIEAWMRVMHSRPLPAWVRLPSLGGPSRPADSAAAWTKKNGRTAARMARRRNR